MNQITGHRQVKTRHEIFYGIGDIFGGGSFIIIGMLFMFYLTEIAGLPPLLAGFVFAIGKVWDAISDPLMGYISDRTRTRFGRRRVYFLIGIIPITVSFFLMWVPVNLGSTAALFAYYSLAYVLFSTVFTMVMVPYSALNAEMTGDYRIRSRMSGARSTFSGISSLIAGTIPKLIIDSFPGSPQKGYLVMAIAFGVFFALPWIIVFTGTWELPFEQAREEKKSLSSIFSQFSTILVNRSFRVHISMYIASYTAMDILMALFAYYLTYYVQKPGIFSIAMGSLMVTQILLFPLYVYIGNRKGKGTAYIIGLFVWATGMSLTLLLGPESSTASIALVCVIIGAGTSAGVMIPWAMLPSIIDVDEIITGEKRSGLYSGAMTLVRKLVQGAIAMPLIGFMLDAIGFVSKQQQSAQTLHGLKFFFLLGPALLIIAGIIAATRFRITPETHAVLAGEIARLRQGGAKKDVGEDERKVCELITGLPYERLFGGEGKNIS